MPRTVMLIALVLLIAAVSSGGASAQIIDPAVHNLERLAPLQFGSEENPASMEPREYKLKVGKGYRLKIAASDLNEYALVAPDFFRSIYIRKLEVAGVEIKAPTIDEIEFEKGGEAELFFVAVRPGTFDFGPKGMIERGTVGKFIVESADEG